MVQRALVTAALGLVALTTACGGALFGSVPSPSPVTADSVRAAFDNSTMQNAHFRATGTIGVQDNHYPVTGDGVLQKSPAFALKLDLTVKGNAGATLAVHEVVVGGRDYIRVGNAKWTSTPETSTSSPLTPTKYVGEETIGGTLTWHAQSADEATGGGTTYDIWVRETDGYVAFLQYTTPTSSLTMSFDTYNQSPAITAP